MEKRTNNLFFIFDIGYYSAEISAMLQIVDDNVLFKGKRTGFILDKQISEIGVSCRLEDNKCCTYILLEKTDHQKNQVKV